MFKNIKMIGVFTVLITIISSCYKGGELPTNVIKPKCISEQNKCEVKGDHESFWVLFNAEPIVTETGFEISLKSDTKDRIINISSYMEGKEMFMGKVPLFFEYNRDLNTHTADSILGSCTDDKMKWIIWFDVTIERKDKMVTHEKFSFEFTSQRYYN